MAGLWGGGGIHWEFGTSRNQAAERQTERLRFPEQIDTEPESAPAGSLCVSVAVCVSVIGV